MKKNGADSGRRFESCVVKQLKVRGKKKLHASRHLDAISKCINGAESVIGYTESFNVAIIELIIAYRSPGNNGHRHQLFLVVTRNYCNVTQIITNKDHPAFQMVNVETNCFDIKFVHAACPTSMI